MWLGFVASVTLPRAGLFFKLFCLEFFGDDPAVVLADRAFYPYEPLPAFYSSMFHVWGLLGGHGVFPNLLFSDSDVVTSVDCLPVKLAYSCLRPSVVHHCVTKFCPVLGDLYWSTTWSQIHVMPFDCHVADFPGSLLMVWFSLIVSVRLFVCRPFLMIVSVVLP